MKFVGKTIYAKELLYKTGQSNLDLLIHLFFLGYDEDKGHILIADSADPQNIAELRYGTELDDNYLMDEVAKLGYQVNSESKFYQLKKMIAGISVTGAIKGPGSIRSGIGKVLSCEVLLTEGSLNMWAEYSKYRYKTDRFTGRPTREPIDKDNHGMDCLRYAALAEGRYFFAEKEK
jgi:phage terminase large subunit